MPAPPNVASTPVGSVDDRLQAAMAAEEDLLISDLIEMTSSSSSLADFIREDGIYTHQAVVGILPSTSTVTVICGPSTVGKSFLALDLAARCVADMPFAGKSIQRVGECAFIVAAEDNSGMKDRAAAWSIAGRGGPEDRVFVMDGGQLCFPRDTEKFIAAVETVLRVIDGRKHGSKTAAMFVFDHLTALAGGESLDADSVAENLMRALHRIAGNFNCPVVAIHHTGRDPTRFRGSQVLFDRSDAFWSIRQGKGDERIVRIDKMRNGPKSPGFRFRLVPAEVTVWDDDPEAAKLSTMFVEHLGEVTDGGTASTKPLTDRQIKAHAALPQLPISESTAKELLEKAGCLTGSADAKRMAFKRLLDDLSQAGAITRPDNLVLALPLPSGGSTA